MDHPFSNTTINGTLSLASGAFLPIYMGDVHANDITQVILDGASANDFGSAAVKVDLFQPNGSTLFTPGVYPIITSLNGVANISNFVWDNEPTFGNFSYSFAISGS